MKDIVRMGMVAAVLLLLIGCETKSPEETGGKTNKEMKCQAGKCAAGKCASGKCNQG